MDKATIMGAKPPKNPPNMDIVSPVIFRAKILISLRFTTAALVMARGGMKLSERLTRSLTTYAFVKKGKHVWSALEIRVQERTAELSKTLHNLEQQMAERQRVQLELLVANEHLQHLLTSSPAIIFSVLFIINDILDFSKLEAGEMPLEHLEFNLENTLDDILDLFALSADEKGLELVGLISPSIPVNYQGDPTRLRQILSNLINNAIKFTESGYVTIEVFNARSNKKFIPLTPPFLRGQGRNERPSVSCANSNLDRGGIVKLSIKDDDLITGEPPLKATAFQIGRSPDTFSLNRSVLQRFRLHPNPLTDRLTHHRSSDDEHKPSSAG